MSEELTVLVHLIANPWNVVLGFCVWAGIQVVKSMVPAFAENGSLHHTLRFACVGACTICYFVPGPWTDSDMDPGTKLILGIIVGTVTTIGHGMVSDGRKFLAKLLSRRGEAQGMAKDVDALVESGKGMGKVLGAILIAFSGVYGAWLKPENDTKAKAAYEVTEQGIESLSSDIADIDARMKLVTGAHNTLDRQTAISMALLRKRLDAVESELKSRSRAYQPVTSVDVADNDLSMAAQVALDPELALPPMPANKKPGPAIKRDGRKLDLPEAKELFK